MKGQKDTLLVNLQLGRKFAVAVNRTLHKRGQIHENFYQRMMTV